MYFGANMGDGPTQANDPQRLTSLTSILCPVQRLELVCEASNAHKIQYILHGPIPGVGFHCMVHIKGGAPIRSEGLTESIAKDAAAKQILNSIDCGSIVFNSHHQLQHHQQHVDNYERRGHKGKR